MKISAKHFGLVVGP